MGKRKGKKYFTFYVDSFEFDMLEKFWLANQQIWEKKWQNQKLQTIDKKENQN